MYELQSLSRSWEESPLSIFKQVEKICKLTKSTHTERSATYNKLKLATKKASFEKFGDAWVPSLGQAPGQENHRSSYLHVSLDWKTKSSDPHLFDVKLRGPVTDKSCRFHRIFGGDRFLMLHLPTVQRGVRHADKLQEAVIQWLKSSEHFIAGRRWRAFWVDDSPPKAAKDKPYASYNIVYMFAVSGVGLDAPDDAFTQRPDRRHLSIAEFIDAHAPIKANINSTDLKLFARFKLGFSKTTPTVILQKHHIKFVPDKIGSDGVSIMNDGCAMMSSSLAIAIAKQMGLNEVPSAFQGRIGGAKGLWLVDYQNIHGAGSQDWWIQINPSQNKILPHPMHRDVCDEYRQFEVNDFAKPPQQPALNTQFLTVLNDRGVKPQVLKACLQEQVQDYYQELCKAMSDPIALKSWLQKYHRSARDLNGVEMTGAFPRDRTEKINILLDAGFDGLDRLSIVRELLTSCIRDYLNVWAEKLRIEIKEESTFLYCASDPSGRLKPGEVHCGLSKGWTNPRNGAVSYFVHDVEGLVARNPANHPSDIQRVKFVFIPELQSFRDVLVFPSVGTRSLASLLSGGDYDGDRCLAIWRQDFVKGFKNFSPGPPDDITPESCGLARRSQSLSHLLPSGLDGTSVSDFLGSCFEFNLKTPMLGHCTNTHEQLVYNTSLTNEGAIKLAALASFLVDSRKQGLELTDAAWSKVRRECCGSQSQPLLKLKYKGGEPVLPTGFWNIIDFLRFDVAQPETEKALKDFHEKWPRGLHYDSYFTATWRKARNRARDGSPAKLILDQLRKDVQEIEEEWKRLSGGTKVADDPGRYPERVASCFEKLLTIRPLALPQEDEIHRRYEDEMGLPLSYWSRLRASCFYSETWKRVLTWYMVGQELCFMNAQRKGVTMRVLTPQMHAITKVDTRAVRSRLSEVQDVEATFPSLSGPMVQYLRPQG